MNSVINLSGLSAIPQTSRFTGTGWPSRTVSHCPDGTTRSVQNTVLVTESYNLQFSHLCVKSITEQVNRLFWYYLTVNVGGGGSNCQSNKSWLLFVFTSLCYRTHPSGHWITLHSLPGSSSVCHKWLSTLTVTCCWWRSWTTAARPLSCSRGCQSSSLTCSSSMLSESESAASAHNILFPASSWVAVSSSRCCRCVREQKPSQDVLSHPSFILAVLLLWNFGLLIVDRIPQLVSSLFGLPRPNNPSENCVFNSFHYFWHFNNQIIMPPEPIYAVIYSIDLLVYVTL